MKNKTEQDWKNATWEGSRIALIKQHLRLSVRQRLLALEELCITSNKLSSLKLNKK